MAVIGFLKVTVSMYSQFGIIGGISGKRLELKMNLNLLQLRNSNLNSTWRDWIVMIRRPLRVFGQNFLAMMYFLEGP